MLAAINAVTIGAQNPNPVAPGNDATYSITVTTDSNRRTQVTSVAGLPAGATYSSTCVQSNSSGSTSITLTIDTSGATTPVGTYTITPTITAYNSSTLCSGTVNATHNSTTAQLVVAKTATTTTITSDTPDPSNQGSSYTVNVSVQRASNSGNITGTVTVSDGTDSCTDTTPSGSGSTVTYSCSLTSTTTGAKTLTASYAGNNQYLASSGTASHTVDLVDGTGTMTVSTAVVGSATPSVFPITPGLAMEFLDFHFTAVKPFPSNSRVRIVIPAGWTAPTLTAGQHGALQITDTDCSEPDTGTSDLSISGSGPWTITISLQCSTGDDFTLRYANGGGQYVFAPQDAGTYEFTTQTRTASGTYTAIAVQPTLTVVAADQTIDFPALSDVRLDEAAPVPAATATSGLAVTYSSTSTACSVTSDGTVTLNSVGTCEINADQAGNANWNAAPQVTRSFTINKGDQAITFPAIDDTRLSESPVELGATASSGLDVEYTSATPEVCSVDGSSVALLDTGTCTIDANQPGDDNWNAAAQESRSFTVDKGTQTITIDPIDDATYGDDPITVSATATSGLEVTFSSTTPLVCSVEGTTVTILAAGTCTVQADQAGDDDWDPAESETASFNVAKADATIVVNGYTGVYDGNPHGATGTATGVNGEDLSADLDLGESFTDIPGGTATWTFTDTTGNYNDATGTVEINIGNPPVAVDDTVSGTEDEDVVIDAADLLENDTDADGDDLRVDAVGSPVGGTVVLVEGVITFTPDADLCGEGAAWFDYSINDDNGGVDGGVVTIDLECVNDAPVAVDDTATIDENSEAADHDVLANDTDADDDDLTIVDVEVDPSEGTASIEDNKIRFTPAADFSGTATVTYVVSDGTEEDSGELVITVNPVGPGDITPPTVTAPTVAFGTGRVDQTAPIVISWSGNDSESGIAGFEVQVSVNGGSFQPVYEGTGTSVQAFYGLKKSLVFRARAVDNEGNTSDWATAAERKLAAPQSGGKRVVYKGTWRKKVDSRASGAGYSFTTTKGSSVRLDFRGRSVLFVSLRGPNQGRVKVLVDGSSIGKFNLARDSKEFGAIVARQSWSTNGPHRIRIVSLNGKAVAFDTFVVIK